MQAGTALSMVCDYIQLNPVRAGLAPVGRLGDWRRSSYRWLRAKAERPAWLRPETALAEAGRLADGPAGWAAYDRYLAWQAADGPAGKGPAYASLSQGWAIGTEDFRTALIKDHDVAASARAWETGGAREVRRVRCEERLKAALRAVEQSQADPAAEPKGAPWKVAVAAWMKQNTEASNRWLAERLAMGSASRVSQVTAIVGQQPDSDAANILRRLSDILAT